jgi:hypothetical protein
VRSSRFKPLNGYAEPLKHTALPGGGAIGDGLLRRPQRPVFAGAVRAHWGIENGVHRVLDTTFDEDRASNRKDDGPENLAILRKLVNVLRTARPSISIRRKRKRSRWSDDFARSVIGQMR